MSEDASPEARALADYVDAAARVLDLPLAPEHRAGVLLNFSRLAAFARLLEEFPLEVDDEPAPVFQPGSPP